MAIIVKIGENKLGELLDSTEQSLAMLETGATEQELELLEQGRLITELELMILEGSMLEA